jgi:beta-N-acetylhexosaminidase
MSATGGRRPRRDGPAARTGVVLAAMGVGLSATVACGAGGAPLAAPRPVPVTISAPTSAISSTTSTMGTSASPSADAAVLAVRACAQKSLARLSVTERAAEVLMIGVPAAHPAEARAAVASNRPGGVFLRGRSRVPATTASGIETLQKAVRASGGPALLVAVDEEGGKVQTLTGPGIGTVPSALVQGRWDAPLVRDRAREWLTALRRTGVTMNLAPVADTVPAGTERDNPPIGAVDRQYGSDPDATSAAASAVVRAAREAGIVATLKHFPGLGRVRVNPDTAANAVDSVADAHDPHLRPFAAGIAAGAEAVMMSSARYPRLDPRNRAVFSARIIGMLRDELGFDGLVVSDDLGQARAVQDVPVGRRAVAFVAAGGDLVLTVLTADVVPMRAALAEAARTSPKFRARLDEAATRVLATKHRAGLLPCRS